MPSVFRETKRAIQFRATNALDYPPHVHEDMELVYVQAGGGTLYCDGNAYGLEPGYFYLVFPHQVHHYAGCVGGAYRLLILKPTRLSHSGHLLVAGSPAQPAVAVPREEIGRLAQLLELALEEYIRHGDSPVLDGYFDALFSSLLRCCPVGSGGSGRDCLPEILAHCTQHYREPLTVEELSRALHISRSHISHTFSRRLGMGFCDYIHALRLSEAAGLLAQKGDTVTEIAYRVGYTSLRTFNRAFRQRYGTTPTAYRRNNL